MEEYFGSTILEREFGELESGKKRGDQWLERIGDGLSF